MPVDIELKTDKFLLRKNGILYATPLLVAIAIVEMTDLVFALDSIQLFWLSHQIPLLL
jgi:tellurite resistance protein TerC